MRCEMNWPKIITYLLFVFVASAYCARADALELTKDNPKTLVSTRSPDYTIHGLRLGITHSQAWEILGKTSSLMGFKDDRNPSRIYVYNRKSDGSKGEAALYLIWEPSEETMSRIAVFQGFRASLSPNVRRLLTFEAIDNQSPFKREFLGYPNRSKVTLDLPSIGSKDITYFYDEIGIAVTHEHSREGDKVMFVIVQPTP